VSIIEVNDVSKEFNLGQLQTLKQSMERVFGRLRGRNIASSPTKFKALDGLDFKIEEGEVVGVIGSNGAGKSTLLKILSRITVPSTGSVRVTGNVAPLIEVGAGLVGDMTGRENIYLNATILGMDKAEIKRKVDDILHFAELDKFADTPLKRYSSGMAIRLGFSIAAAVESDILIVDEVLAVGDLAFQRKCFDRMEQIIKRQGRTVLIVSHNIRQVERMCSRAILLDHGKILADGPARQVCNLFFERSDDKIQRDVAAEAIKQGHRFQSSGEAELLDVTIFDANGTPTDVIQYKSNATVALRFKVNTTLTKPAFGIGVHTSDFVYLATDHCENLKNMMLTPGIYEIRCKVKGFPFLPGVYALKVGLAAGEFATTVFYTENASFFRVTTAEGQERTQAMQEGVVEWDSTWSGEKLEATNAPYAAPLALLANS
jgi:lipopolysaccharide transport system ATP-binding protein